MYEFLEKNNVWLSPLGAIGTIAGTLIAFVALMYTVAAMRRSRARRNESRRAVVKAKNGSVAVGKNVTDSKILVQKIDEDTTDV